MTEVVEKEELRFLDLDEGQFGLICYLSSVSAQRGNYINTDRMREEMLKVIESGDYKSAEEALAWVRGHRNNLLNLSAASALALNIICQVDDNIVNHIFNGKIEDVAVEEQAS